MTGRQNATIHDNANNVRNRAILTLFQCMARAILRHMKTTAPKIPRVALLIATDRDWGRNLIRGVLSFCANDIAWDIWVKPNRTATSMIPTDWNGDGIIAHVRNPELGRQLTESGLPVVSVSDNPIEGFSAPCVRTDDPASTRLAAEHFIERGFRQLAFIGSCRRPTPIQYAETFQQTVEAQGLTCHRFPGNPGGPNFQARLTGWLKNLPKPIGLLTTGQNLGSQVIENCRHNGIIVPHDIAVLSANYDELMCLTSHPALSGIISPTRQIGYKAAELLQQMMDGKHIPHETIFIPPVGLKAHLSTDTLAIDDLQMAQVIEFIREHAFEPITLDDILRAVPMAKRTLDRRFQKAFGRTPTEEIKRMRINKARQLLTETDIPMQLIAERCGYATYNYLTHIFKRTTGKSPSEYRKQTPR